MREFLSKLLVLICFSVIFVACEDEPTKDTEAPKVEGLSFVKDTVHIRDSLILTATYSDNEQISGYKMEIKATFDKVDTLALFEKTIVGKLYYEDRQKLEKDGILTKSDTIIIPAEMKPKGGDKMLPVATGKYTLKLFCMDMWGNQDTIVKDFVLIAPRVIEP